MPGEQNGLDERDEQLRTGGDVRLVVPAAAEYLRLVRLTAAGMASRLGFTFDEVEDLRIAVDELCFHLLGDTDDQHPARRADRTMDLIYSAGADFITITGRTGLSGADPRTVGALGADPRRPRRRARGLGHERHDHLPTEETTRVIADGVRSHRPKRTADQARGVRPRRATRSCATKSSPPRSAWPSTSPAGSRTGASRSRTSSRSPSSASSRRSSGSTPAGAWSSPPSPPRPSSAS